MRQASHWGSVEEFRRAVQARDPRAWEEVVARYARPLLRQAQAQRPGAMEPADAVAQTWLQAVRYAHVLDPGRPIYPWLTSILVRICIVARQRAVRQARAAQISWPRRYSAAPRELPEAATLLRVALSALSARDRTLLILRFFASMPSAEVAHLTGMAAPAVRARICRALRRLRSGAHAKRLIELIGQPDGGCGDAD